MSRRDYIATAEIIRELHVSPEQRAEIVSRFVTMFSDDNPRFSPSKFREACEPEPEADEEAMRASGEAAGRASGSWVSDGNSSEEHCREVLRAIEGCEFEIQAPLSGEYADGWTAARAFEDADVEQPEDPDAESELLDAWEDGYRTGYEEQAAEDARGFLPVDR